MENKRVAVLGGPIIQKIDPVSKLVPIGRGELSLQVAQELNREDFNVTLIGSFPDKKECPLYAFEAQIKTLNKPDAIIFMAHLPNVKPEYSQTKLRAKAGEKGQMNCVGAEKLINNIKKLYPKTLLVAFKLAESSVNKELLISWMLTIRASLVVYSILDKPEQYWIMDVFGNTTPISKKYLPIMLTETIKFYLSAIRRESILKLKRNICVYPLLSVYKEFIKNSAKAFEQIGERNVNSERWPGNLSARYPEGFIITRRNVEKTSLIMQDFVLVSAELNSNEQLEYCGPENTKPSVDAPIHRVIYEKLRSVKHIVHGHCFADFNAPFVHKEYIRFWPCGAEQLGLEIIAAAPKNDIPQLWVANIRGHGFIALISDNLPGEALGKLSRLLKGDA